MENVIITGGTGGLGGYLTDEFLRDGCQVFALDIVPEKNAAGHEDRNSGRYHFLQVDMRSEDAVKETIAQIAQRTPQIDLLVNCCGILPENSAHVLEDHDIDSTLDVFNVNTLGPLRCIKHALPLLRKGKGRTVVNISSEAGSMMAHANYTIRYDYCGSKAAMNIQSIILQRYLKEEGFKVLLFNPGWMRTQIGGENAPLLPADAAAALHDRIREQQENDQYEICLMDYDGKVRAW